MGKQSKIRRRRRLARRQSSKKSFNQQTSNSLSIGSAFIEYYDDYPEDISVIISVNFGQDNYTTICKDPQIVPTLSYNISQEIEIPKYILHGYPQCTIYNNGTLIFVNHDDTIIHKFIEDLTIDNKVGNAVNQKALKDINYISFEM